MTDKYVHFHKIIEDRTKIDDESPEIKSIWSNMIDVFSENIDITNTFILEECSADEFSWLSEIFDGIAERTQNFEFINSLKTTAQKYPEEVKKYYIMNFIESAEGCINQNKNG